MLANISIVPIPLFSFATLNKDKKIKNETCISNFLNLIPKPCLPFEAFKSCHAYNTINNTQKKIGNTHSKKNLSQSACVANIFFSLNCNFFHSQIFKHNYLLLTISPAALYFLHTSAFAAVNSSG